MVDLRENSIFSDQILDDGHQADRIANFTISKTRSGWSTGTGSQTALLSCQSPLGWSMGLGVRRFGIHRWDCGGYPAADRRIWHRRSCRYGAPLGYARLSDRAFEKDKGAVCGDADRASDRSELLCA